MTHLCCISCEDASSLDTRGLAFFRIIIGVAQIYNLIQASQFASLVKVDVTLFTFVIICWAEDGERRAFPCRRGVVPPFGSYRMGQLCVRSFLQYCTGVRVGCVKMRGHLICLHMQTTAKLVGNLSIPGQFWAPNTHKLPAIPFSLSLSLSHFTSWLACACSSRETTISSLHC